MRAAARHVPLMFLLTTLVACGPQGASEPTTDAALAPVDGGGLRGDASALHDAGAMRADVGAPPADAGVPSADAGPASDDGGAADAGGGPDVGSAGPDAGPEPSCTAPGDCPELACSRAACEAGRCSYLPADLQPCSEDGADGYCHAGACHTGVRQTRALAVVTDFADRTLEDYFGTGFATEADIRAALDEMEQHWWWASLGTHRVSWDLVRIRLTQSAGAAAFADWAALRDAAAQALQDSIDASSYDSDQDGIVDAAYFILATGTAEPDWAMGGMSRHKRVNLFVDGQDSLSVRQRAIGNFNHELGHCLGLPDLYGTYGTIYWLSFMHDSWPVPPMGLSAYDRIRLGWMAPQQIAATTRGLELAPAESSFSAVRVPGPRSESFLIEYRRRPSGGGYGSMAPAHDGLAIYHVLDGASQAMNPPLLKLEPADGAISTAAPPQAADLWRPGDPPFVGRSWVTGEDVFRLENLEATASGRRFDVVLLGTGASPPTNLLQNASFEDGTDALPDAWSTTSWLSLPDTFAREALPARDGAFVARIANATTANDAALVQSVAGLKAGTGYLLCGWLRGEQIVDVEGGGIGANLSLMGTWTAAAAPLGTFDWTHRCVAFAADGGTATVGFRLGFYGSTVTGRAFADALSLEELRPAFP